MHISIYSTTTCAYCHVLTSWLDKEHIAYIKKNTDEDSGALIEFMAVNEGNLAVPFTVLVDDTGVITKIVGFDKAKFKEVLDI